MTNNSRNIGLLVVSCDKYSDLWEPFFACMQKNWPDCPYEIYLLANYKNTDVKGVRTILIGEDLSWSDNVLTGLSKINEDYIIMFIDDLLIKEKVDTPAVKNLLSWMVKKDANYLRLSPTPKPDKTYNDLVGIVSPGTIYRASTVLSVWKKNTLCQLLVRGESAWDFEVFGTVRSDNYNQFYSTHFSLIEVLNSVIKGKWQKSAIEFMQRSKITYSGMRNVMSLSEAFKFKLKIIRSKLLTLVPARYRRKVKEIFVNGKYNYMVLD